MSILNEAANVTAPIAGTVIQLDIDSSGDRFVIPATHAGRYCTWEVYGDTDPIAADIAFGTVAVDVTYNQDSSVDGSGNITISAVTGMRMYSNAPKSFVMPIITPTVTHFFVESSGNGKLKITPQGG